MDEECGDVERAPGAPTTAVTSSGPQQRWKLIAATVVGWFIALSIFGCSRFVSCGNLMIGYSKPEPPSTGSLNLTLLGFLFAMVVGAGLPIRESVRTLRSEQPVWAVLWIALSIVPIVVLLPSFVDAASAVWNGDPGAYCVRAGYEGG